MKETKTNVINIAILLWLMIGVFSQCESKEELSSIKHELRMMQYK